MRGTEMGPTQDKVSLLLTSDAISVPQRRPKRTSSFFFFFKGAHLVLRQVQRETISPKHCNKSASQPGSYNFTAASPSVERG